MDEPVLQDLKFGLAVLGTLLLPLFAWVSSLSYKTGAAKTTLDAHGRELEKLDDECQACRKGIGQHVREVHEGVIRLQTQMEMLLRHNGVK